MKVKRQTDKQLRTQILFLNIITISNMFFGSLIIICSIILWLCYNINGYSILGFILGHLILLTGFVVNIGAEQNKIILELRRKND